MHYHFLILQTIYLQYPPVIIHLCLTNVIHNPIWCLFYRFWDKIQFLIEWELYA